MKEIYTDLLVIGGGPAGLAAALEGKRQGIEKVLLIERDSSLGGILQQCIHDGFGLQRFGMRLSGGQYAQRFIDEFYQADIDYILDAMVLEINRDRDAYVCCKDGIILVHSKAIVLAMGCRERTASQSLITGSRPAGVLTAGAVQRYINMAGYLPGKKAVIFGSGDIGLIMARRMKLEGIEVEGVYARRSVPSGLTRNVVQCLEDYDIPLHLNTAVISVHGRDRVTSVTVAKLDEKLKVIPGTEQDIECDLLVLAVGLIPENELAAPLKISMDPKTKGAVLDDRFMTEAEGVFAAGNVSVVFDLVDYVSESAEIAARGAAEFIRGEAVSKEESKIIAGENVSFCVPQKIRAQEEPREVQVFLRVKERMTNATLEVSCDGEKIFSKFMMFAAPPEMVAFKVKTDGKKDITVSVKKG